MEGRGKSSLEARGTKKGNWETPFFKREWVALGVN